MGQLISSVETLRIDVTNVKSRLQKTRAHLNLPKIYKFTCRDAYQALSLLFQRVVLCITPIQVVYSANGLHQR